MAKLETLLPSVRAEVPGAMDITIIDNIRRAAIDFCERTKFYREEHDPLITSGTIQEYDLDPPSGTVVSDIIWVTYDGDALIAKTDAGIRPHMSAAGTTQYYSLLNPKLLVVAPQPAASKQLKLRVALKPKPTATSIEDYVYDEWSEAFYHGALYRMLNQPGKDWSNPEAALYHQQAFFDAVNTATDAADNSGVSVAYTVKYGGI